MSEAEDISKIMCFKLKDYLDVENSKMLEIIKGAEDKKIRWYDLIYCKLKSSTNIPLEALPSVHLPAGFLKMKGLLADIDVGDEKQFRLDFNNFKKNNKTIDDLFEECTSGKKQPTYRNMLEYCRYLYRAPSGGKDVYNEKNIDQAEKQLNVEFKNFTKGIVGLSDRKRAKILKRLDGLKKIKNFKKDKNNFKMKDLFKLFILYRSIKITGIEDPLNTERDSLPYEAKVNSVDDIFFIKKDNVSVAPLDGILHSTNEIFIQKFYALIWINSDISDYEAKSLMDYMALLESMTDELVNEFWNENLITISGNQLLVPTVITDSLKQDNICDLVRHSVLRKFNDLKRLERYNLNNCLCEHKIRISTYGYLIVKLYIKNKLKMFTWHKSANEIITQMNIDYPDLQKLKEIKEIVKTVKIDSRTDFINLFNNKKSGISNADQNKILDIIFSGSKKPKRKKCEILDNNFKKISLIYVQFICKYTMAGVDIKYLNCYNLIVSSYLYFKLNKQIIKKNKIRNFATFDFDDRRKEIGALYTQIEKRDWCFFYYYYEIAGRIFGKYYTLFNLKKELKSTIHNEFSETVNKALINVWSAGLKEIYKFAFLSTFKK